MKKGVLRKKIEKKLALAVNRLMGSGLAQEENRASGGSDVTPGMPEAVRALATEGIVLLKNDRRALPIRENETAAVFGRVQRDWFTVGYGSGGDVHPSYTVGFFEGLDRAGVRYDKALKSLYDDWASRPENEASHGYWGNWPYNHEEMPLSEETVRDARKRADLALVVIGRAAGEDRENKLTEGSYYLTATERDMLRKVTAAFDRVALLLNCGNVIDMAFTEEYRLDAILYVWQLGQESGNAIADVLSGRVSPSGKLADTVARSYEDYPSAKNFGGKDFNDYAEGIYVGYRHFVTFAPNKVLYPFGFGLGYTSFDVRLAGVRQGERELAVLAAVANTGDAPGKETVQLYVSAPQGALGKAKRSLCGFQKTALLPPGETGTVEIAVPYELFASYDDTGVTGHPDAFVLEAGTYRFFLGTDCLTDNEVFAFDLPETLVVRQCREACAPAGEGSGNLRARILAELPREIPPTGDRGITFEDVKAGRHTLDAFIAQLSDRELADLTRGEGAMNSSLGAPGNAGAFGGITKALRDRGIPPVITADGPSGLRLARRATLLPCGTAVACAWNLELTERVFTLVGEEARRFGVDVILSPGLNIHRDPLCGRNFEYYSEDPLLSGRTAAAAVRGIQQGGAAACPKHFACNNQEFNRNYNDSRVSRRALREIYLKNFELCVREGRPRCLMTSYNKINGVWSHYNYDLATTVLRGEWGFDGCVVTDWWMRRAQSPEFPLLTDNAYRVRAQVDVLMPGNMTPLQKRYKFDASQLASLGREDGLTRAELQRSARNVLRVAMGGAGKTTCRNFMP